VAIIDGVNRLMPVKLAVTFDVVLIEPDKRLIRTTVATTFDVELIDGTKWRTRPTAAVTLEDAVSVPLIAFVLVAFDTAAVIDDDALIA